jgi:hypothetical protein
VRSVESVEGRARSGLVSVSVDEEDGVSFWVGGWVVVVVDVDVDVDERSAGDWDWDWDCAWA